MKIPSDRLQYISIVVRDLRVAAAKMAKIYGITEWEVVHNSPEQLTEQVSHGFKANYDFSTAVGFAQTKDGPVNFLLVQPGDTFSTYMTWLITRGEGIMGLCLAEITPAEFDELKPWLGEQNVEIVQSHRIDGIVDHVQLDTRAQLGGFYTEILVAEDTAWRDKVKINERWDLSSEVPDSGPLMPIISLLHFGVVVRDLISVTKNWHRLFGCAQFDFWNWRVAPDSLVNPVYNSKPVDHEYFTSMPNIGDLLSFELIQPTFGPSHYKEDFLIPLGEGIHHVFTHMLETADEWPAIERRMAEEGAPVCMGGGLGDDIASFYYLDTRKVLPGFVTEFGLPGKKKPEGNPFPPAMTADYRKSTRANVVR